MRHGAPALGPPEHPKVRLVAVQIRQEHDARLVRVRGGLEDVARQRDAGRERPAVPGHVAPVQGLQRGRRSGRDRVEDPQQRVAVPMTVSRPPPPPPPPHPPTPAPFLPPAPSPPLPSAAPPP